MSVSAAVLANLCVSYIMTFQNEEAEELMRKVERAEETKGSSTAGKQYHHLCIVNLVVGTLYCAKGNFEFGLSRIIHALEGGSASRLYADTWLHVKRCILGLLTSMSKQNLVLPYGTIQELMTFLKTCESKKLLKCQFMYHNTDYALLLRFEITFILVIFIVNGLFIPANIYGIGDEVPKEPLTIGLEARKLRWLLLKLTEYEND